MTRRAVHIATVWTKGKTENQAENGEYKAKFWPTRMEGLRARLLRKWVRGRRRDCAARTSHNEGCENELPE